MKYYKVELYDGVFICIKKRSPIYLTGSFTIHKVINQDFRGNGGFRKNDVIYPVKHHPKMIVIKLSRIDELLYGLEI